MAFYRCLLHGQGYPGQMADHANGLISFYVNRVIEADHEQAASSAALKNLKIELQKRCAKFPTTGLERLTVEEVAIEQSTPAIKPGFIFYSDDEGE